MPCRCRRWVGLASAVDLPDAGSALRSRAWPPLKAGRPSRRNDGSAPPARRRRTPGRLSQAESLQALFRQDFIGSADQRSPEVGHGGSDPGARCHGGHCVSWPARPIFTVFKYQHILHLNIVKIKVNKWHTQSQRSKVAKVPRLRPHPLDGRGYSGSARPHDRRHRRQQRARPADQPSNSPSTVRT